MVLMLLRGSNSRSHKESWHLTAIFFPRRSISGKLVYGLVWRRYNGRRWIYKRVVDYKDPEDDNRDAVGPRNPSAQNTERRSLAELAATAPPDHGREYKI
jgi:hypothetical protein